MLIGGDAFGGGGVFDDVGAYIEHHHCRFGVGHDRYGFVLAPKLPNFRMEFHSNDVGLSWLDCFFWFFGSGAAARSLHVLNK